jgi:hypothetical protein
MKMKRHSPAFKNHQRRLESQSPEALARKEAEAKAGKAGARQWENEWLAGKGK